MSDLPTVRELLLARAEDDSCALLGREREWTWREYVAEAARLAERLRGLLDPRLPPHVGLLMTNGPDFALHLAAAGLGGHVAVGLNTTRRGESLLADIRKADVQVIVTDESSEGLLDPVADDLGKVEVVSAASLANSSSAPTTPQRPRIGLDDLFMLIFTSGTSGEPKAVRVTHRKVTQPGDYLCRRLGLSGQDRFYISMPMFHSNGLLAGWAPALICGAAFAVVPFSASGFLPDVRRFAATYAHYVGKPLAYILATAERDDDHDNPLRLVFGNEAGDRDTVEFSRRFGTRVIDGFGSTENAVVVSRTPETPPGSLGQPFPDVKVLDPETAIECPRAMLDDAGQVLNLDECVGELVNVEGAGQFAGYYNDEAATAERLRGGMYWSGDLAYRDAGGWVYFAGRTADWLRVDGENLAAAPVERILLRHLVISEAAVYAVADPHGGDRLAAALVLRGSLDQAGFEDFLSQQSDLGPKQWPRLVSILQDLPRTATNKVLKRELPREGEFTWEVAARRSR